MPVSYNIVIIFFLLYVLTLVTGCATSTTGLMIHELPEIDSNNPVIYIYYPDMRGPSIGLHASTIYINKTRLVKLDENRFTRIEVDAGTYVLTTSQDWQSFCFGKILPDFKWPPVEIGVENDKVYYLRYSADDYEGPNSRMNPCERHLHFVGFSVALRELPGAEYVISNYKNTNIR